MVRCFRVGAGALIRNYDEPESLRLDNRTTMPDTGDVRQRHVSVLYTKCESLEKPACVVGCICSVG